MYTLRIIEEIRDRETKVFDQIISNHALGSCYTFVKKGTKFFDECLKNKYPETDKTTVSGLVLTETGNVWFLKVPEVNRRNTYYVMTDTGKTFERLE